MIMFDVDWNPASDSQAQGNYVVACFVAFSMLISLSELFYVIKIVPTE